MGLLGLLLDALEVSRVASQDLAAPNKVHNSDAEGQEDREDHEAHRRTELEGELECVGHAVL